MPSLKKLFDLREGAEDKNTIIENVKDDSDFSSARFWTLVSAIVVASIGLNINSIPVVIGAMLISPLTGPIVSIGLALAIYDWGLMRRSLRNLFILVAISIFISTLYFALSPITNAQSELLSRIQPTIFDVLIAVFGGIAGFIGISRSSRHNNVIPGVAIATAIMPPLCTVGYGIATFQLKFIFGAFFLFLINCIFICLSALVVASYMELPKKDYPDEKRRARVKRIISVIIFIIVVPAIYLAYTFVSQNNFYLNADKFIKATFEDRGQIVIYKNIKYHSPGNIIELAFLSDVFSEEQIAEFQARLLDFKLDKTTLIVRQNSYALSQEEWQEALSGVQNGIESTNVLEAKLEAERNKGRNPDRLLNELRTLNPKVTKISLGVLNTSSEIQINETQNTIVFVHSDIENPLGLAEANSVSNWLKSRLEDDNLIIHFNPQPTTPEIKVN